MGCTNSTKKQDVEIEGHKTNENGLKNFYATKEFDISTSESEDENEILSIDSIKKNSQKNLTKKIEEISTGLTTANTNGATTNTTLLDNRLHQTAI